jgi:uncharacterized protein YabE (DUF348 family)
LKIRKILYLALATLVVLGASLALGLRKTVTLSINGQSRSLTTYALTVAGLLRTQAIPLGEQDELNPPLEAWLKPNQAITLTRAIPVQIWADGELLSFTSPSRSPAQLLSQAGLQLDPADQLLSNGQPYPPDQPFPSAIPAISLQINRSLSANLVDGEQAYPLSSTAPALGDALWEAGINYIEADRLDPPASTPLQAGLQASLRRASPLTIHTQEGDIASLTTATTVGSALVEAGLALQGLDYSIPDPTQPVPAGSEIRLVRVREEVLIEQTPLPFETQYQPVSDLALDNQTVVQTGEYGLSARRLRIRYEDGVEVSRLVESEWVARQSQARIIGYGTQIVLQTAVVDGITIEYWRSLNMWATSYYPAETSNTTASGLPLQKGVAAVDIRYIPFYTRMYVPGYGEALAADTGSGVIGRWIDLGYSDEDYVSWHSWVTVYFLWPPPENIVWIIP